MKLYIEPIRDAKEKVLDNPSAVQLSQEMTKRLLDIKNDFAEAQYVRDQAYEEFNDRDLVTTINDDLKAFNSNIPPAVDDDPNTSWRSNVVKPLTRSKAISIAANVTAAILYPNIIAENQNSELDRDAAMVMKDLADHSYENSKYEKMYTNAVIAAMYSPAVFIEDSFSNVFKTVKELNEKGYTEKEVMDEVFSGFQNHIVPCEDIFISNAYEPELQKQPFLIKRRIIDYTEAKLKYGNENNFSYVQPGIRTFYVEEHDSFYERYEESLRNRLVEEVTYYNRLADLEIVLVNGIPMYDDPNRPMQRQDKLYPFVHFGFEPFNARFFYSKSLVAKIAPEQHVIDVLYGLAIDASMLQTMPPGVLYGDDIDSAVVVPGKVSAVSENSKYESLDTKISNNFALTMIQAMEQSVEQNSAASLLGGSTPRGANTAFEVATIQENAMKVLGLFGKMVKVAVEDFGNLRIGSILQFLTVAQGLETVGDTSMLRFRQILIPERVVDGKKQARKIEFKLDKFNSEEEVKKRSYELLNKEKALDMSIAEVNPTIFRTLKYRIKVEADMLFSQSETVKKALNLEAYDRAINNPIIAQNPNALREVTRKFLLNNYVPGDEEKYLPQEQTVDPMQAMMAGGMQQTGDQTGMIQKLLNRQGANPTRL